MKEQQNEKTTRKKEFTDSKTVPLHPPDEDVSLKGYFEYVKRVFWQEIKDLELNHDEFYFNIKSSSMEFGIKTSTSKYVLCRARKRGIPFIFDNTPLLPIDKFEKQFKPIIANPVSYPKTYHTGLKGVFRELAYLRNQYPRKDCFSIYVNPIAGRGIDILVLKEGEPYAVYEITNYDSTSFLDEYNATRYLTNLSRFVKYANCSRYLVVSFKANLYNRTLKVDYSNDFTNNGVTVIERGKQA